MRAILVNGLYRTGTTMLTEFLGMAGYYIAPHRMTPNGEIAKEHVAVRRHSNKLLKSFDADWIHPKRLVNIDNVDFDRYLRADEESRAWRTVGEKLVKEMEEEAKAGDYIGWAWKDTRLPITMPAWKWCVPHAKHIIGYRSPDQFLDAVQKYRSAGYWGFKNLSDDDFIWVYNFYYTRLLEYLDSPKAVDMQFIGIDYADWFTRYNDTMKLFCDFANIDVPKDANKWFSPTRDFDSAWLEYDNDVYQQLRERLSW